MESDNKEDNQVAVMGIFLNEVRKGSEHETKSKITGKLKTYLEQHYPKEHQQIHAHVISLNSRALVGVLLKLGLLDDEVKHITGDKGKGDSRKSPVGIEGGKKEGDTKAKQETDKGKMSSKALEHETDRKGKKECHKIEANGVKVDDKNPN